MLLIVRFLWLQRDEPGIAFATKCNLDAFLFLRLTGAVVTTFTLDFGTVRGDKYQIPTFLQSTELSGDASLKGIPFKSHILEACHHSEITAQRSCHFVVV